MLVRCERQTELGTGQGWMMTDQWGIGVGVKGGRSAFISKRLFRFSLLKKKAMRFFGPGPVWTALHSSWPKSWASLYTVSKEVAEVVY